MTQNIGSFLSPSPVLFWIVPFIALVFMTVYARSKHFCTFSKAVVRGLVFNTPGVGSVVAFSEDAGTQNHLKVEEELSPIGCIPMLIISLYLRLHLLVLLWNPPISSHPAGTLPSENMS